MKNKRNKKFLNKLLLIATVIAFIIFMIAGSQMNAQIAEAQELEGWTILQTVKPTPTPTPIPSTSPASPEYHTKSQRTKIYEYLVYKFGDRADDAITMIRNCENDTFDPNRLSPLNYHKDGRVTIDVGVMMINVDANNTEEIARLKDYKYNIDRGFEKFKNGDYGKRKNSFYLWTCGNHAGDYTYVDRLKGK